MSFPLLNHENIIYLDNAATTQKPWPVLEAMNKYYTMSNANPMRGLYDLSIRATDEYESARETVANFINASDASEIIFTRNATESLNLVAYAYDKSSFVLCGIGEHHSNLLPWSINSRCLYLSCEKDGSYDLNKLEDIFKHNTIKIFAINGVSNVTGQRNDIKSMTKLAHQYGAIIVVDGTQMVAHESVDVQDLDVDFFAFSGHKMYGPMGIGVLYGKKALLNNMPPFLWGGEMVEGVKLNDIKLAQVPHKFEAGTVNVGGAVGLKTAIDFINNVGFNTIKDIETKLIDYAFYEMKNMPHINIIGGNTAREHHGIISFTIDDVHPHDAAEIFASENIAIRAGYHCAQPLHEWLEVGPTLRMSVAMYNTEEDIRRFLEVLKKVRGVMAIE